MQTEITKKCADSLRAFAKTNYNIKIKSSHAHEIVAAYFGYSSRAALLADTQFPITNLRQAEIIVLTPAAQIEERYKGLEGLPETLPHELAEGVYLPLYNENDKWILTKIWPNFDYLARFLVNEALSPKPVFFSDQKVQREGVKVECYDCGIYLTVLREYVSPSRELLGLQGKRGVVYTFDLKRVAGYIGYKNAVVSVIEAETLDLAVDQMKVTQQSIPEIKEIVQVELSFTEWLKRHVSRDSPLRDLTMDIVEDKNWPTYSTFDFYLTYLLSRNASGAALQTLERDWKSYEAFLSQKNSGEPRKTRPQ